MPSPKESKKDDPGKAGRARANPQQEVKRKDVDSKEMACWIRQPQQGRQVTAPIPRGKLRLGGRQGAPKEGRPGAPQLQEGPFCAT